MFQTQVSYSDVPALFSVSCPTEGTGVWHKSTEITEWVCSKQLKFILSVIQLQNFTSETEEHCRSVGQEHENTIFCSTLCPLCTLLTSNWETVVGQRFPCFRRGLCRRLYKWQQLVIIKTKHLCDLKRSRCIFILFLVNFIKQKKKRLKSCWLFCFFLSWS